MGMSDKPDYISVHGYVTYIKHDTDPWYTACPSCNKKVIENTAGKWTCEKCNKMFDNVSLLHARSSSEYFLFAVQPPLCAVRHHVRPLQQHMGQSLR